MRQRITNKYTQSGLALLGSAALITLVPTAAMAQDAAAAKMATAADVTEIKYVLNTLLFLIGGFLVMWMAAGFAMLEAGMVRSKNVSMQCTKNIALYAIAGLMFWVVGYNVMYEGVDPNGFFGSFSPKSIPDPAKDTGSYSAASDWFFQMVFCATTASIVSGTVAERVKIWPFLIFVAVLTGIIYPITGSWKWGAGWLQTAGFQDFAGSTLVHSVGGWCALTGAIIIGARYGKFGPNGEVRAIPGSNMTLVTLGTFILWLGWFGFNGGSQLAMGSIADVSSVSRIFMNTNLAAAAGVMAAMFLNQMLYGKVDLTFALNGALAGLVAITAEPLTPSPIEAIMIGAVGGLIVVFFVPLIDNLKIDDVVGAIPVHLISGVFGTMVVPLTNPAANFVTQAMGVGAIAVFSIVASTIVWLLLKYTIGLRPTQEEEMMGLDKAEIGLEAYPEFQK